MAPKKSPAKKSKPALGEVVIVHTKSSSYSCSLLQPQVVTIEGMKFIEGIQVTGKVGHRMERKRTLIPYDHIASIVEFQTEEDLWSEPQPKHIRVVEENKPSTLLTSHEQPKQDQPHRSNHHRNGHNRNRPRHGNGNDARFQERYDSRRDRGFNK